MQAVEEYHAQHDIMRRKCKIRGTVLGCDTNVEFARAVFQPEDSGIGPWAQGKFKSGKEALLCGIAAEMEGQVLNTYPHWTQNGATTFRSDRWGSWFMYDYIISNLPCKVLDGVDNRSMGLEEAAELGGVFTLHGHQRLSDHLPVVATLEVPHAKPPKPVYHLSNQGWRPKPKFNDHFINILPQEVKKAARAGDNQLVSIHATISRVVSLIPHTTAMTRRYMGASGKDPALKIRDDKRLLFLEEQRDAAPTKDEKQRWGKLAWRRRRQLRRMQKT